MSINYADKELQFLASLAAETGRTLEQWMAAISAAKLSHRNDVIDWLRREGLPFSKASWLERIHNNGGKPVYSGAVRRPARRTDQTMKVTTSDATAQTTAAPAAIAPQVAVLAAPVAAPFVMDTVIAPETAAPQPASAAVTAPAAAPQATQAREAASRPVPQMAPAMSLTEILARAKGLRPLAQFVVSEIQRVVPDAIVDAQGDCIMFQVAGRMFAALTVSAKELRLGLAVGIRTPHAELIPAKLASANTAAASSMSHMIVLTDARQVSDLLRQDIVLSADG